MKKYYLLSLMFLCLFLGCEEEEDTEKPTVTITFSSEGSVFELVTINRK